MPGSAMKKRRIPEDEALHSKKKKVEFRDETPPLAASFSVTKIQKPQVSPPVVALTPGITLSDSFPFDVYQKDEQPAAKRRKGAGPPPPSEMALHSSAHRTVDYTAREERFKSVDTLLNHFLAIIDPQTGEIEVVQAKKMVVRGTVRAKQAPAEAMEVSTAKPTHSEMRMELGETFGTKKAKKAIQAVAEDAMLAAKSRGKLGEDDRQLVVTIRDSSQHMATREELQAAVDKARPVPRGNFDADEIQDVYVPAEIIGAEVLNAIPVLEWQEKVRKTEPVQVPARFVAHRIVRVAGNEDGVQRLKLLRYLLWVIVFWTTTRPGRERGTKSIARRDDLREALGGAPEVVIENIRRKFSDNGVMRKAHIDLLMTHCCVFASIIDNFEVDTLDLREDLKLEQKDLNQYFVEIGARVRRSKAGDKFNHIAKLSLPLQFPKMRQPPKRM
ncbi:RNA polymerase I associated factor, A49-like protein [Parathielavia hyrcaniae]|uniref:RNA polymerase I associated factor, A49-like protein n=1 Tax=Parathielavia hyrcaniae TaxID=113614 RepID=A0AAN6T7E7_9PEZI|nr:RNA polymerase I associated factor, A49-like protein [Parathielavia hyrcaniae]